MKKDKKTAAKNPDIAERKRAEENLRRLAAVVRASNDAIIVQDIDGRITAWNRGAELMYGYSEAEALQMTIWQLSPPNKAAEQKDFNRRIFAGEKVVSFETQRVIKDGRILDIWLTVTKLMDAAGKVIGIASTERDITERKRTEETLRRLAAVVRASNDAIIVQDIDGRITAWNRGAELMYGYSEAEALGMNIDQLSPPDKVSEQKEFTRRLIAGEAVTSFETQRVTKDGSILDVWLTVTKLVEDPADSIISTGCDITMPIGVALIERNITLRKKAEAELRESEEKYREVVERANDGIIILQDAIIQYSNQRVSDIAGYEASEIIGASMANYIHPDELTKVLDRYKRRMAGEHVPQIYDTVLVHKDGNSVNVELNAGIINYQGKPADLVIVRDITERKKIEETLRQKAFLLDSSSSIIGTCDLDGRMTYANPAFLRGLGYDTLEEILERQFGEFWMVQDQLEEIMTALLGNVGPRQWIGELRVKRKDGSLFDTQVSATTVLDVSGKPISLMSTSIDITERKQAEEALAFKNIILSTQQETSLDGILVVDDNEKIISYNQRFVELWGIPFDVVESKSDERALRFVTDKLTNPEEFIRKVQHLYESRQETSREESILKDGRTFDRYSAPMLGADGQYFGRVWYFRDITERKQAQQALRKSEEKYRTLAETTTDIVYSMDGMGNLTFIGPQVARYDLDHEKMLGRDLLDFVHPEDREKVLIDFERTVKSAEEFPTEFRVLDANGVAHWIEEVGRIQHDSDGAIIGITGILRDITKRKRAEQDLLLYKVHLEELVKERTEELDTAKIVAEDANKAKSDFLANMSHEIRTPLSTIIGFSDFLYDEVKDSINDEQKKYFGYITSSGQHLLSLINDILDLSKVEAGKMELLPTCFSIGELLKTISSFIAEKAVRHNIKLLTEISADVDMIEADERKAKQVLYNLLSNAVKFTPDGGFVTIGAKLVKPNSAAIPSGIRKGLRNTEYVLISVKDTGIGIAKKDQPKLFTEFRQIEDPYAKKYEGTGLGLALSKRLVALHGGRIWFKSRGEGKGCTFYFILPFRILPNA